MDIYWDLFPGQHIVYLDECPMHMWKEYGFCTCIFRNLLNMLCLAVIVCIYLAWGSWAVWIYSVLAFTHYVFKHCFLFHSHTLSGAPVTCVLLCLVFSHTSWMCSFLQHFKKVFCVSVYIFSFDLSSSLPFSFFSVLSAVCLDNATSNYKILFYIFCIPLF